MNSHSLCSRKRAALAEFEHLGNVCWFRETSPVVSDEDVAMGNAAVPHLGCVIDPARHPRLFDGIGSNEDAHIAGMEKFQEAGRILARPSDDAFAVRVVLAHSVTRIYGLLGRKDPLWPYPIFGGLGRGGLSRGGSGRGGRSRDLLVVWEYLGESVRVRIQNCRHRICADQNQAWGKPRRVKSLGHGLVSDGSLLGKIVVLDQIWCQPAQSARCCNARPTVCHSEHPLRLITKPRAGKSESSILGAHGFRDLLLIPRHSQY
mmetsp:Transcript_26655/g.58579  ORF Transcript_26655/g.58579 Transcript_26655/m.58579 type:complete len:261 (+) Transcript_26655:408-1190(+)